LNSEMIWKIWKKGKLKCEICWFSKINSALLILEI
jgi:hypothetical protein